MPKPGPRRKYFLLGLLLVIVGLWSYTVGDRTPGWERPGPWGVGAELSMTFGGLSMLAGSVITVGAGVAEVAKGDRAGRLAVGLVLAMGVPATLLGARLVLANYGYTGPGDTDASWSAAIAVVLGWGAILLGLVLLAWAASRVRRAQRG